MTSSPKSFRARISRNIHFINWFLSHFCLVLNSLSNDAIHLSFDGICFLLTPKYDVGNHVIPCPKLLGPWRILTPRPTRNTNQKKKFRLPCLLVSCENFPVYVVCNSVTYYQNGGFDDSLTLCRVRIYYFRYTRYIWKKHTNLTPTRHQHF